MDKIQKIEIAGYTRPITGEYVNGDAFFIHQEDDYTFFAVIDGIGHGQVAHQIASKLTKYIKERVQKDIAHLMSEAHYFMKGSEGAALGLGIIENNEISFCTIGNINARIINQQNNNIALLSTDGLIGVRKRTPRVDVRKIQTGDLILIHSDGVNSSNSFHSKVNYHLFTCEILSRKLVKEWGSEFDDATMLCIKIK
ncbi:SpoIIE family protein phosphatase [Flammeovirga yaeyamensis]|uniref:SpoIIE family protein phosphatase n=1 Tax=Flammeovirga yaeyamensis TaxID=367791 RepID=A0AAX1NBJ5_9BACT|nr:SpoIIE family protein phosphatase [Flammeovirga yaeyamensis]MBB3697123.1 serine phosphatase RsbU (regulator of sigma subunit) [Flammeovirga yaeyamensis]NMF33786.1 SpoIIE family protein phosphatase [Flammeovirga yaeyamensis]QWG04949.1 SpoIIE family protein phosphatase [Flammeovirga yaeyamensis]